MNRRRKQLEALKKKLAAIAGAIARPADSGGTQPAQQPRAQPWESIRASHPELADQLDDLAQAADFGDVDRARIAFALRQSGANPGQLDRLAEAIGRDRSGALVHPSQQRNLPGTRFARHNLLAGQVRLGEVVLDHRSEIDITGDFGIDLDVLRTSMLVIGPPGSGKTRGIATPIVEHLSLAALTGQASMVVVDPKSTDFAYDGWFDVTIDPLKPSCGFSLFGGSRTADVAADRLASALLPPQVSDDKAYFIDASKNALYACLAPFETAFERWPTVPELLGLLRAEHASIDRVKERLKGAGAKEMKALLDTRRAQTQRTTDPAASLVERFALLDRPALRKLLDHPGPTFQMRDLNRPVRVRVALPEAEYPDASRILARLVVSQFVQITSSSETDRSIFKALVIDEAGRFVDDYVARGVQKLRSNNAGMVLLSQTMSDFPIEVRATVFGSTGCKAVFGGIDPQDADVFSRWFGDQYVNQTTINRSASSGTNYNSFGMPDGRSQSETSGFSVRRIERARWTVSDIITGVPSGHALVSLARSNGVRVGPVLVNLRA
ncbi:type IV secretion system coupling TraD/TrwB family protein [Kribbella sp. VKM Ac-2527]|uniref:Type IV secretion system coupling TraD/TrwB family protein n=1 Tax=Kribbella caucasensis TaxID=2512215 RepID=A0A4R6K6L9_9ACTN|nr:TraM recognition domain-containing protein [Kribbella sp. VKM Ac-2527]TDO44570.1 type IV secretion system coupling TraD/TrwB family protein [Kribbella sp. VKM Ac-2527]